MLVMDQQVEYISHMGDDNTVANVARVSYDKWGKKQDKNEGLIEYLAKHNHHTPFCHPQITFRITCPIFVRSQLGKHQVGLTMNEVSRRYVDDEPSFYIPDIIRGRSKSSKQGSTDNLPKDVQELGINLIKQYSNELLNTYNNLLKYGIAPEQARMILPQNMMTSFIWTGSLLAFNRIYKLRTTSDAQRETAYVANMIGSEIVKLFPISWKHLNSTNNYEL